MGTDHLPRDAQAQLDEPSLRDEEHTEDVRSLREENARLRGLLVQLSNLICKNVVHAR
jgi:hypothetical protein